MASRAPRPQSPGNRQGSRRNAPDIPDHEVLRQIGHGSFGEVWIAKAVTGVFRAVKVIHREDFEYERDFEREFEAIKRYEPISRQHPGLVHILQVGRDDDLGIYYYIMEVADDYENGTEIDSDTYVPYTFRAQLMSGEPADLDECIEHGAMLAEALHFLHERDLIHRDVKLSNVIIVDGEAKLADIGLIAALGDRSFVGTEGYVPPEGAGTASADIFSLGMVIYELSTGKDRLDFPDVPTNFREIADRATWRQINQVVCKACARRVEARYETAEQMAQALRGEEPAERKKWPWIAGAAAAAVVLTLVLVGVLTTEDTPPEHFDITTEPSGADVYAGADLLGQTPLQLPERPQEGITFEIQLRGYNYEEIDYAGANDTRTALHVELEPSKFPQIGSTWNNSLDLNFVPIPGGHRMNYPVHADMYLDFAISENRIMEGKVMMWERDGEPYPLAMISARESRAFAEWMQARDLQEGFIGPDYSYRAVAPDDTETDEWPTERLIVNGRQSSPITPFVVVVGKQGYGSVEITSIPEGAEIYTFDGELVGMTPHSIPRIKTGPVSYEIRLEGFKPHYFENRAVVVDGLLELKAELEAGQAVAYGKKWVNSIGMEFEPVGEQLLVSKFETRRREFEEFIDNNDEYAMPNHGHSSQGVHPVDAVSRVDAEAFCTWLTEYERANNYITIRHVYRLPTDEEWSQLAGLPKEPGATPENRNNKIDGIFPWGYEWPPPPYSGNFSDESRASLYEDQLGIVSSNVPAPPIIVGYDDGVPEIGWAREHNENRYKLHQVSGNVWEWVSTNFTAGSSTKMGVIRGGSWETAERTELLSSHRRSLVSTAREPGVGFRVVLTRVRNGN